MYSHFILFISILLAGTAFGMEINENNTQSHFETLPEVLIEQIRNDLSPNTSSFALTNRRISQIVLAPIRQARERAQREQRERELETSRHYERVLQLRRRTRQGGHSNW